jgi:hypothetical protein
LTPTLNLSVNFKERIPLCSTVRIDVAKTKFERGKLYMTAVVSNDLLDKKPQIRYADATALFYKPAHLAESLSFENSLKMFGKDSTIDDEHLITLLNKYGPKL